MICTCENLFEFCDYEVEFNVLWIVMSEFCEFLCFCALQPVVFVTCGCEAKWKLCFVTWLWCLLWYIMLLKSVFLWMVCVRNWCLVFYDVEIKWILDFVIWNMVFGYLSLIFFLLSVLMRLSELLFYVVRHNVIVNWVCCSEVLEYGDESYWTLHLRLWWTCVLQRWS